ncbi:asparagine--tRNA ligase, partial [archaeon]|nr:asparagine--tRNA ligase [archaeon]
MMKKMTVMQAMSQGKGSVELLGWVHRERHSNKLAFIVLRDESNTVQCVIEKDKVPETVWNEALKAKIEASIQVKGEIVKDERAPTGFEVKVQGFKVIGISEDFPITKDQSIEFLLDNRHLWLRSRRMTAILKVRSTVFKAIHDYFGKAGFYEFQSPCLTSAAGESGSTQFKVDYFGEPMFLTQTWQLYAEAGVMALEKIYCIAPSFRAEPSKTSRHLTEYWHAEMEACWIDFNDLMDYAEGLFKHVATTVLNENKAELLELKRDVSKLEPSLKKKFPRITYDEALKLLKDKAGLEVVWGKDIRTIEEDELYKLFDSPFFITNF